jgi:hypothetical protein
LNDGIERYQGIANTIVQLFPFHGSVVMRSSLPSRQTVMKKSHLLILPVFAFLAFAAANAVAQQSSAGTAPVHAVVTVEAHKELENRCINTIRILSADAVQKANAFHHGNHGRVMGLRWQDAAEAKWKELSAHWAQRRLQRAGSHGNRGRRKGVLTCFNWREQIWQTIAELYTQDREKWKSSPLTFLS